MSMFTPSTPYTVTASSKGEWVSLSEVTYGARTMLELNHEPVALTPADAERIYRAALEDHTLTGVRKMYAPTEKELYRA